VLTIITSKVGFSFVGKTDCAKHLVALFANGVVKFTLKLFWKNAAIRTFCLWWFLNTNCLIKIVKLIGIQKNTNDDEGNFVKVIHFRVSKVIFATLCFSFQDAPP